MFVYVVGLWYFSYDSHAAHGRCRSLTIRTMTRTGEKTGGTKTRLSKGTLPNRCIQIFGFTFFKFLIVLLSPLECAVSRLIRIRGLCHMNMTNCQQTLPPLPLGTELAFHLWYYFSHPSGCFPSLPCKRGDTWGLSMGGISWRHSPSHLHSPLSER